MHTNRYRTTFRRRLIDFRSVKVAVVTREDRDTHSTLRGICCTEYTQGAATEILLYLRLATFTVVFRSIKVTLVIKIRQDRDTHSLYCGIYYTVHSTLLCLCSRERGMSRSGLSFLKLGALKQFNTFGGMFESL